MTTKARTISVAQVKKAGACSSQVQRFAALFGAKREIEFTRDVALIIVKVFARDSWVADYLMTPKAAHNYRLARSLINRNVKTGVDAKGNTTYGPNTYFDSEVADALVTHYRARSFK